MPKNIVASTSVLLSDYSFDLGDQPHTIDQVVQQWLRNYPPKWVMAAIVEAIFQGRYKVASVDSILFLWYLRGRPLSHFDHEFADLICGKFVRRVLVQPLTLKTKTDKKHLPSAA